MKEENFWIDATTAEEVIEILNDPDSSIRQEIINDMLSKGHRYVTVEYGECIPYEEGNDCLPKTYGVIDISVEDFNLDWFDIAQELYNEQKTKKIS